MENAKGKEGNSTEKPGEEYVTLKFEPVSVEAEEQPTAKEASTAALPKTLSKVTKRKRTSKEGKENAKSSQNQRPRKKIVIPPLPSKLPPVNLVHRDIVRAWCHQLKLSTKGQKLDAYKRLCEYAYPNQKNIPATAKDAKIRTPSKTKSNVVKGKTLENSEKKRLCPDEIDPPEIVSPPEEGTPPLDSTLLEGINTVVVTTSAQESVLASWTRIAGRAGKVEAVKSPQEAYGVRWCVVHGRSLPADTDGWVQLQFHAGQVWVPEKPGRVSALFLLPACNFPPPHLEDNMLCPKCVQRNKVLMKSLQ